MPDITMSVDETLELDEIIEEWSRSDSNLSFNGDKDSFNLSGIQTKTSIINPQQPGTYTITVNGRELSVEVIGTNAIPDSAGTQQWNNDEGSGTTLTDSIGSLNGAITNLSWVSGETGTDGVYLDYDGAGYVDLGSDSRSIFNSYTVNGVGTMLFWVYPTNLSDLHHIVGGFMGPSEKSVGIQHRNDNALAFRAADGSGNDIFRIDKRGTLNTDEWQVVAGTADGSTAKLYRAQPANDYSLEELGSDTIANTETGELGANINFGREPFNDRRYWSGRIDLGFNDSTEAKSQSTLQTFVDDSRQSYE